MSKARTFEGLTKAQTNLLGRIACGDDSMIDAHTIAPLVERGLVERREERSGMFAVYRYSVPLPVHIRWAQWCAGKA